MRMFLSCSYTSSAAVVMCRGRWKSLLLLLNSAWLLVWKINLLYLFHSLPPPLSWSRNHRVQGGKIVSATAFPHKPLPRTTLRHNFTSSKLTQVLGKKNGNHQLAITRGVIYLGDNVSQNCLIKIAILMQLGCDVFLFHAFNRSYHLINFRSF